MARGPVNKKQLAIESFYGYMNIYLERLHKAFQKKSDSEIATQIVKVNECRNALIKLGYFEGRNKK